jgi:hypothetical protein
MISAKGSFKTFFDDLNFIFSFLTILIPDIKKDKKIPILIINYQLYLIN